jgi:chlorite dismutase
MSTIRPARPETVRLENARQAGSVEIPPVPLTVEGYSVLHQMMRFRWSAWRPLRPSQKAKIVQEAAAALAKMEQNASGPSAFFSLLGHKGDLMFVHFRQSFDQLNQVEMQLANLKLSDYLEPATSYLSVIELGNFETMFNS